MAVTADAYSLIVDDAAAALRVAKEFFGRVGEIKKTSERSVKSLIHHPDGFDCLVKAKVRESSRGSRLQLSKRSGDGFVFSLVFNVVREALRVGLPPMLYHGEIYKERTPSPAAPDAVMSELVLPPTMVSGFYEWPEEMILEFSEQHQDVLNRIERGDLDVYVFISHVEKIPRSLLDSRSIKPTMCNVFETCEKVYELLSDARAFWA